MEIRNMNKPFEVCLPLVLPPGKSGTEEKVNGKLGLKMGSSLPQLSYTTERGINTTRNERYHWKENRDDQHLHS